MRFYLKSSFSVPSPFLIRPIFVQQLFIKPKPFVMYKKTLLAAVMAITVSVAAAQKTTTPKKPYDKTLLESRKNHKQRIQEGIKDGDLSKKEAKAITDQEKKIKQAMYKAKQSGGVIDETERAEIKQMQLELDKMIEEKKKNDELRKQPKAKPAPATPVKPL